MLTSTIINVPAGGSNKISSKIDFQSGTCIGTVIPVTADELNQMDAKFVANFKWSVNNKFWITEQICDSSSTSSSGEVLITTIQSPYVNIEVINKDATDQKFFIVFNVPGTASNAV